MEKIKCPNCGSNKSEWGYGNTISNGVVQGRLNTNDVQTFFYLGCMECSETVSIISCDDVIEILNKK